MSWIDSLCIPHRRICFLESSSARYVRFRTFSLQALIAPIAYGEALSTEIAQFGLRVLLVQPGAHRTDVITSAYANILLETKIPDYEEMREKGFARYANQNGKQPGDALKAMQAVVDVVRGEGKAAGKEWPLWLVLGNDAEDDLRVHCEQRLKNLEEWLDITRSTTVDDGDVVLI